MNKYFITVICFFTLALFNSTTHAQEFTVSADRTDVQFGDTLTLRFSYNAATDQETPDFSILQKHFHIHSYYPTVSRVITDGQVNLSNTWDLIVEPKIKGSILIPPISFRGARSNTLQIRVKEVDPANLAKRDLMLETIVDKSSAYVQEQILVTYRLYYSRQVEIDPEAPEINDAIVTAQESRQYQRRVDGELYRVVELPFTIFPQRSGTLVVPRVTWNIRMSTGVPRRSLLDSFGRFERRSLRSDEKVIRIKPIPDSFPQNATWLPASALNAEESWSEDTESLGVGEPVTRSIMLTGQGLDSAQLPQILDDISDTELKVYLEPAKFENAANDLGMLGKRIETGAYVLTSAATKPLPEINIPWWNTTTDTLEMLTINEKRLSARDLGNASMPSGTATNNLAPSSGDPNQNTDAAGTLSPALSGSDGSGENSTSLIDTQHNHIFKSPWFLILLFTNVLTIVLSAYLFWRLSNGKKVEKPSTLGSALNSRASINQKLRQALKHEEASSLYSGLSQFAIGVMQLPSYRELIYLADKAELTTLHKALSILEGRVYGKDGNDTSESEPAEGLDAISYIKSKAGFADLLALTGKPDSASGDVLPELY